MHAIDSVWQEYHLRPTLTLRNQLVQEYDYLAAHLADRFARRFHSPVADFQDLRSVARIALLKAIENFDPARETVFPTYCGHVIQGALYDELRRVDTISRHYRRLDKSLTTRRNQLEQQLGRRPTSRELSEDTGRPEESLHADRLPTTGSLATYTRPIPEDLPAVSRSLQREDLFELAAKGLSTQERRLLAMYYFEGQPMRIIAAEIGLTESRVSQMHTRLLVHLRNRLADRVEEFSL